MILSILTITIIIAVTSIIILVWIGGFLYSNDFTIKNYNDLSSIKRVMVVFAHADDEALTTGGFIFNLTKNGKEVYWIILTKGEKGNPKGIFDEKLKEIRVKEARKAADIYKIKNIIQKDYPDGAVGQKRGKLEKDLREIINDIKPDLIITYDLSGLYGHPDHIATSEIITKIVKTNPQIKLWYVSFPKRILNSVSFPEHMAKDKIFKNRRVSPTHKILVGLNGIISKIKISYVYQSQGGSSSRNMPFKFIPFWFYISLTPIEYFYEVQKER